jgi:hypothetical protein
MMDNLQLLVILSKELIVKLALKLLLIHISFNLKEPSKMQHPLNHNIWLLIMLLYGLFTQKEFQRLIE